MKIAISKTVSYAIRALAHMARGEQGSVYRSDVISKALDIPDGFLKRILVQLGRQGIVHAIKGPNGGYVLREKANKITLLRVVEAVEGPVVTSSNAPEGKNGADKLTVAMLKICGAATDTWRTSLDCFNISDLV